MGIRGTIDNRNPLHLTVIFGNNTFRLEIGVRVLPFTYVPISTCGSSTISENPFSASSSLLNSSEQKLERKKNRTSITAIKFWGGLSIHCETPFEVIKKALPPVGTTLNAQKYSAMHKNAQTTNRLQFSNL